MYGENVYFPYCGRGGTNITNVCLRSSNTCVARPERRTRYVRNGRTCEKKPYARIYRENRRFSVDKYRGPRTVGAQISVSVFVDRPCKKCKRPPPPRSVPEPAYRCIWVVSPQKSSTRVVTAEPDEKGRISPGPAFLRGPENSELVDFSN